ncbi:MAG: flavodoxin family protein [Candidatus Helarchaeota archaeon]
MRILICYHTETGNTEKVATSIAEALKEHEVMLCNAKDVDPISLKDYEVVFLGSGTYAASCGKFVKKLIKKADSLPPKFALFYTHASPGPNKCFYRVKKELDKKKSTVIAEFECLGATKPTKEQLEVMTPEQKAAYKILSVHPNEEDLENAKQFAKDVVKKN